MFSLKIARPQLPCVRSKVTLVKRVIPNPQQLCSEDLQSILWTALDIRHRMSQKKATIENIKGAHILLLLREPSPYLQVPAVRAASMLKAKVNILIDPNWDTSGYITDTLRFLQTQTDLLLTQCRYQCFLDHITELAVPLFVFKSFRFKAIQTLSDLMTIHTKYGRLRGLKIAWLGLPNPLLNSYLTIGTKLGINISFCCSCEKKCMQSPAMLEVAKGICNQTHSVLEECTSPPVAIRKAHVIVTSKKAQVEKMVTLKMLEEASPESTTLFHLPRTSIQVDETVINSDRCLTWKSAENMQWIFAAVMLRLLSDYDHTIPMPYF